MEENITKAYNKELKRIKQIIKRAEKKGFIFDEEIIPPKPKKLTQGSVNRLRSITPEKIYGKSKYASELSGGEIVSGKIGIEYERGASKKKPKASEVKNAFKLSHERVNEDVNFFDNVVISGFRSHVKNFNERASNLLLEWLDMVLSTNDTHDVAIMLQKGAETGNIVNYQIVYSTDKLHEYISNMINYLPEAGPMFKADMMEALEIDESYDEI